jgi:hypothetical protein
MHMRIARYGEHVYSKAREAERIARKQRKGQLANFYAKLAKRIEEVSTPKRIKRPNAHTKIKTAPEPEDGLGL